MITEPTPLLDHLNAHALACRIGIAAAERCAALLPGIYHGVDLERLTEAYTRRADHFRLCLSIVEAQIAALPKQDIYPERARAEWRTLVLAHRAGHVTWREFGMWGGWLRRRTSGHG
jgi:hypothetical protein